MHHLLLVEDDEALAGCVRRYLQAAGYEVAHAPDCATARQRLTGRRYAAVILDLMLPDGEGLDLCRGLDGPEKPVVVAVSARGEGTDRLLALEAGADMYLAKPFDLEELVARVGACLRRGEGEAEREPETCGDLSLDPAARQARIAGRALALTPKEFDLLATLTEAQGRILPGRQLLWEVWGYAEGIRTRTLDVHVGRLRQKLAAAGAQECRIVTKSGVGYGMEEVGRGGGEVGLVGANVARSRATAQHPPAADGDDWPQPRADVLATRGVSRISAPTGG